MNAQEFLATLERRGFKPQLHPRGGISIVPTFGLTSDDRATLKQVAAELERILRERASRTREPSAADCRVIDEAREAFDVTAPVEIRDPQPRQASPAIEGPKPLGQKQRRTHNWPLLINNPSRSKDDLAAGANDHPENPREAPADQQPLPLFVPPTERKCTSCGRRSFEPAEHRCRNCGALLPPARLPLVASPPSAETELPEYIEEEALMEPEHVQHPPSATVEKETKMSQLDTLIANPPEQAAVPATNQSISDEPPESKGEVKAAAPLRAPAPSSGPAAPVASDLPAFRDHIRSRRTALAGFMEQGALLAFENGTLSVFPRNDIYVRYLADNRQVIGELATEFFGCAVKVELAGPKLHTGQPK
jgi:hypothetical protein